MREEDQASYILKTIVDIFRDSDDPRSRSSRLRCALSDAAEVLGDPIDDTCIDTVLGNLDELSLQVISEYVFSQGLLAYSSDVELTDEDGDPHIIRIFATSNEVLLGYLDSAVDLMADSTIQESSGYTYDPAPEPEDTEEVTDPFDIN